MRTRAVLTIASCAAAMLAACAQVAGKPIAEINGKRYVVEVADTPDARDRGLMFRQEMAPDAGMLFIFEDEAPRAFWMKNTYIPLDILYFDGSRRLVSAQLDVPPCGDQPRCPPYPSAGPARYVLELNAGQSAALGLKPGDTLKIEGIAEAR
jgi:uncharacterized membrane protein (UPF0127 family)